MPAPDPTMNYRKLPVTPVSRKTFNIAGILVTVYGVSELPVECTEVACLWLLHPRLLTQECMAPLAATVIGEWNKRRAPRSASAAVAPGLIAVSFDQRNHGTRLASALANKAWDQGNPTHALDMFSGFTGTARDTAQLLDYLPAYVFPPPSPRHIASHAALGISLGGHCAWHLLLHVPAITTVVSVIGCPDYARLLADRARKSNLPSYAITSPAGTAFFGSADFPPSLIDAVMASDPRGLLVGRLTKPGEAVELIHTSAVEQERARAIMVERLSGKRLQCLSGGEDKLVPYSIGKPFMDWLKGAVGHDGWAVDTSFELEDLVFDGVGHDMSPSMVEAATRFIVDGLAREATAQNEHKPKI